MSTEGGYTLIELMIVVGLVSTLAGIAVPGLLGARTAADEAAALVALRAIATAQTQFQAGVRLDQDLDGTGEYGFLTELCGHGALRERAAVSPPVLSASFQPTAEPGVFTRGAYRFRVWLPGAADDPVAGAPDVVSGVDPDRAESCWACLAWPSSSRTGGRAFLINQQGTILATPAGSLAGAMDPTVSGPFAMGRARDFALDPGAVSSGVMKQKWVVEDRR